MTEFEAENKRLATERELISGKLGSNAKLLENKKREIVQYREYLWEHHAHDEFPPEQLQEVQRQENAYSGVLAEQEKLIALYNSPYFARIDFKEDGEAGPEEFYIGRYGFIDDEMEMPVYDWRSPVASLFYDYEYGKASYNCPVGDIGGELLLKRQLLIEKGILKSMFDSSLEIQDEILQHMLSSNTSEKMKTIITTIQREQNKAIRDESTDVLVVSGNAGSGKTSIALHRISYLLYRHRDTLNENNIIIFSPSDTFNGYISEVLPALGEKTVRQTTLQEFATAMLEMKTQSFFDYIEAELNRQLPENRRARVAQKGSQKFAAFIEKYTDDLSVNGIGFKDILSLDEVIMSAREMTEIFKAQTVKLSVQERLGKVKSAFYEKLEQLKVGRVESLKAQLVEKKGRSYYLSEKELTADARVLWFREFKALEDEYNAQNMLHCEAIYLDILKEYFGENVAAEFKGDADGETVSYEDIAPLLVIKCLIGQLKPADGIRQAVIDEAQDYSFMQFKALSLLLRYTKFTILGDVCQTVNRLDMPENFDYLKAAFDQRSMKFMQLRKTYRSTKEISEFAASTLGLSGGDFVERHGESPEVRTFETAEEKTDYICSNIAQSNGLYETTAIITKTKKAALQLFDLLKDKIPVKLIADAGDSYTKGILLMPAYLAKGLEFDSVIVDSGFDGQTDKNLLYVCCTRALHRLAVIR